jgi:hypothetical protein
MSNETIQKMNEIEENNLSFIEKITYKNKARKMIRFKWTIKTFLLTTILGFVLLFIYGVKDELNMNNILPVIEKNLPLYKDFLITVFNSPLIVLDKEPSLFIGILLIFTIPSILSYIVYKLLSKVIYRNNLLVLGNITDWEIKNIGKNFDYIDFNIKPGSKTDESQLENGSIAISRELNKGRGIVSTIDNNISRMIFDELLPTVKDITTNVIKNKTEDLLKDNQLYLGVVGKKQNPIYTLEEEWRGKITQHGLIVGGSGSGKSFFFTSFMNNWLGTPEAYKDISNIYIVGFKGLADYEEFKKFDKVKMSGTDVKGALKIFKQVELEMNKRNTYLELNKIPDGRKLQKCIFIIDEAQTIQEMQDSQGMANIDANSWGEISRITNTLAAKSRSANISLFMIMQKGTSSSINTTVRSNLRHRFALKNDNMEFLLDKELIEQQGLNPKRMTTGQLYYLDTQQGYFQAVFSKSLENYTGNLSLENDSEEDRKIRNDLENTLEVVLKSEELKRNETTLLEIDGRSTYFDTNEQLVEDKEIDYTKEAIKMIENGIEVEKIEKPVKKVENRFFNPKKVEETPEELEKELEETPEELEKELEETPEELEKELEESPEELEKELEELAENTNKIMDQLDENNVEELDETILIEKSFTQAREQGIEPTQEMKDKIVSVRKEKMNKDRKIIQEAEELAENTNKIMDQLDQNNVEEFEEATYFEDTITKLKSDNTPITPEITASLTQTMIDINEIEDEDEQIETEEKITNFLKVKSW